MAQPSTTAAGAAAACHIPNTEHGVQAAGPTRVAAQNGQHPQPPPRGPSTQQQGQPRSKPVTRSTTGGISGTGRSCTPAVLYRLYGPGASSGRWWLGSLREAILRLVAHVPGLHSQLEARLQPGEKQYTKSHKVHAGVAMSTEGKQVARVHQHADIRVGRRGWLTRGMCSAGAPRVSMA
jgi:hypothetical protein